MTKCVAHVCSSMPTCKPPKPFIHLKLLSFLRLILEQTYRFTTRPMSEVSAGHPAWVLVLQATWQGHGMSRKSLQNVSLREKDELSSLSGWFFSSPKITVRHKTHSYKGQRLKTEADVLIQSIFRRLMTAKVSSFVFLQHNWASFKMFVWRKVQGLETHSFSVKRS